MMLSGIDVPPDSARAIYDDEYAGLYEGLYLRPWPVKHAINQRILDFLLPKGVRHDRRWLDLCCGQAWHFSCFGEVKCRVGVDVSAAQLKMAQMRNLDAKFLCVDVLEVDFAPASFDLVTCFWSAYCYLDDIGRIAKFLRRILRWTSPGGAIYLELLVPDVLVAFNDSEFARRTGFRVEPRSPDYAKWTYLDAGGRHLMASPSQNWFVNNLSPHFTDLQVQHDGGFMCHLVATGRR